MHRLKICAAAIAVVFASCAKAPDQKTESADEFVARMNTEYLELSKEINAAQWTHATYINQDTELLEAKADERNKEFLSKALAEAKRYEGQTLKPETSRAILLLKLQNSVPAPNNAEKRAELAKLSAKLDSMYGSAKYCPKGPESCKDQGQLV